MAKTFRPCAGAIVFNSEGKVLLGNRADLSGDNWQFPQGGIEAGETPECAAKRELFEETSVRSVNLIHCLNTPFYYEFPEEIKCNFRKRGIFNDGQKIYFSLFYFTGNNEEINLNTATPEFKSSCWESLNFAAEHIVSFKKDIYEKVAQYFTPLIAQHLRSLS
jgi:putative (di)nucleoside polyphosphate hydrolase